MCFCALLFCWTLCLPACREAYLQQQRLGATKGARADLASLQQALDRATCPHTVGIALALLSTIFVLFPLPARREAYLQQQRLEAAKGARADLASLQQALDRAKKAGEEAAGKLERAKKAEQDAKRGVEREKQREMLKDIKEKSKADKEKQKQVG
jgi:uncharacterized membrane protein YukC